jgi:hypothetical protein
MRGAIGQTSDIGVDIGQTYEVISARPGKWHEVAAAGHGK